MYNRGVLWWFYQRCQWIYGGKRSNIGQSPSVIIKSPDILTKRLKTTSKPCIIGWTLLNIVSFKRIPSSMKSNDINKAFQILHDILYTILQVHASASFLSSAKLSSVSRLSLATGRWPRHPNLNPVMGWRLETTHWRLLQKLLKHAVPLLSSVLVTASLQSSIFEICLHTKRT